MPNKKSTKINKNIKIKQDVKTSEPKVKETSQSFFKRKLHIYGQYKQCGAVILERMIDAVRCSVCNQITFFAGIVSIPNDKNPQQKPLIIQNVCEKCLGNASILFIHRKVYKEIAVKQLPKGTEELFDENVTKGKCSICGVNDDGHVYWYQMEKIALKFFYCKTCLPLVQQKVIVNPVHIHIETVAQELKQVENEPIALPTPEDLEFHKFN